jgi:hypothetical protein
MNSNSAILVKAALLAGIVGNIAISLYLSFALPIFFRTPPLLLFQWDASNIVGGSAYRGGWNSAMLGLFFDFIVASIWGACFVLAYTTLPFVRRMTVVSGLVFGAIVWAVMFYIVVPLGRAQHPSSEAAPLLSALVAHTLFFGLPVAIVVRKTLQEPSAAP